MRGRVFIWWLLAISLLGRFPTGESRGEDGIPSVSLPCAACHLEDELRGTWGGLRMLRRGLPEAPLCPELGPLLKEVTCTERAYVRFRWDVPRFRLQDFLPAGAGLRTPESLALHMGLPLKGGGKLRLEAREARSSLLRIYQEALDARKAREVKWARWILIGTVGILLLFLFLVIRRGFTGG